MEPANDTVARHALVVLHKTNGTYFFIKVSLLETLEKVTSGILEYLGLDNYQAFYSGFYNFHTSIPIGASVFFLYLNNF